MKKIGLFVLIMIAAKTYGQTNNYSIEINPFVRYDKQRYFFSWETVLGGKNFVSPRGLSHGVNVNFQKQINKSNLIFFGLGFYKHSITNIKRYNDNSTGNDRLIKYPSALFVPFFTDKYAYNSLSLNIGYKRNIEVKKGYLLNAGIDLAGLYTVSQNYHLTTSPDGNTNYKQRNGGFWGILTSLDIGLIKNYRKFKIGPELKIPILTSLKTDVIFPNETGSEFRNRWFGSMGIGISFIYKLTN